MHNHENHHKHSHEPYDGPQAVCFGEILFDHIGDKLHLGGAPLNFAYYLAQLGIATGIVSAVGADELGNRAIKMLYDANIDCRWVAESEMPTGVVEVSLVDGQPSYTIVEGVAWDNIPVPYEIGGELFYFGTLAQRTAVNRETAHSISHHPFKHVFLDVNLRQNYYAPPIIVSSLSHSTFVKMNEEEWPTISRITASPTIENLITRYNLHGVALTKGENGATLMTRRQELSHPGFPAEVVDTVGAGDAFSAVIAASLLLDIPLELALESACRIGAYVVGNAGAQVPLTEELKSLLRV